MCYQIIELYNACRCLYYQHAIDRCVSYGKPGHSVQKRTIFVGYACTDHTSSPPTQIVPSLVQNVPSVGQAAPSTSEFYRNPHRALGPRLEAASSYRVPSNLPTARPTPQDRPSQQKALEEEQADKLDEGCEETSQAANYGISGGARQRYPDKLSPSTHTGRALSQEDITKLRPKTHLPSKTGSEKDLVDLAVFSLIEGDLKLLWRRTLSQALSLEEAEKIVRQHVLLHFSYLELLANSKVQHTLVYNLRLVTRKVGIGLIQAAESNTEKQRQTLLQSPGRPGSSQELVDRQAFLAHRKAIETLKTRLKITVTDESHSLSKSRLTVYLSRILNVLDRLSATVTKVSATDETEGTPKAHMIKWTCPICGRVLKDKYFEKQVGAVEKLQMLLETYSSRKWKEATLPVVEAGGTAQTQSRSKGSLLPDFWNWVRGKCQQALPQHRTDQQNKSMAVESCQSSQPQPQETDISTHKFVLLCILYMRWGTKAHQPDVCAIESDQQFFNFLRVSYDTYRAQGRWNWLKSVKAIDLVKFELFRNELANVYESAFSPVGSDFEYEESDTEPPIGPNLLMHLFEKPEHADIFPVLFRRIPRKMKERLRPCPKKGSSIGWGVHFKEMFNGMYVFAFGCIDFLLCLIISVVYTLVKDDIQGGFAVGGFVLAFLLFCGGTFQLYI